MTNTLIPPGTVVVGLDGSPSADRALDWAIDHAVRERRQLTLAHGSDLARTAWADPTGVNIQALAEARRSDAQALLEKARQHVAHRAPELSVHHALWVTDPRSMLLELAETAYTVVVGSRGHGPVRSLLLGSVGVAVVRHATCPVVVVRPGNPGLVRNGVVVGADGSPASRTIVELAYHHASLRGLPLTIVHGALDLWPPDATADDLRLPVLEPLSGLAEKYPDVPTRFELVKDDPAAVLVEMSSRMDLVVVGAHHAGRLATLLTGSVALSVVEHAESPVVVAP